MTPCARLKLPALLLLLSGAALPPAAFPQLTALGAVVLDSCDPPADCVASEHFSRALAVADFNGDGFEDLAVGVEETVAGAARAGEVHIFYGSPAGLTLTGAQRFNADSSGMPGVAEADDRFGFALAAEDFDGDDFYDLAIGVPFEDIGTVADAGAVIVLFGSASGLVTAGVLSLNQNALPSGSAETAEENDQFGLSFAVSRRELAVGVPGETFIPVIEESAGRIHVLKTLNSSDPLGFVEDYEQNDFLSDCGASDGNEFTDSWGFQIAKIDFAATHTYVIASPFETHGGLISAGRVTQGFAQFSACFDQNTPGVLEEAEEGDFFGGALAAGDFDSDGDDDLAIGAPFEEYVDTFDRRGGGVNVLFGGSEGLTTAGDEHLSQVDFPLVATFGSDQEQFGLALATGDFDGDGHSDLVIGAPMEKIDNATEAGTIHVAYGDDTGFDESRHQTFHSDFPTAMPDSPNSGDHFGRVLASGDFDGSGTDDLAVGMPDEDLGAQAAAGAVTVLYGLDQDTGAFGTVQHADDTVTYSESDSFGVFLVSRTGGAVLAATVDHARTGGTATPNVDFSYSGGTESWDAGSLSLETLTINFHQDTLDEPNETILVTLSNPSAGTAVGSPAVLTVTLTDDDVAGSLSFVQPVSTFFEPNGTTQVPVTRSNGAASAVTVQFATSNGTATAGSDYVATSGTLTWAADETTKLIPVAVLDDGDIESGEVFLITLSNPGGSGTLGTFTTHQVVIIDDLFTDRFETGDTSRWDLTNP